MSTLLISLFKYKAWANDGIFIELEKLDSVMHEEEYKAALRILNHMYVVDRIFAAHLSGLPHIYTTTNTPDIPKLEVLRDAMRVSDHWYIEYINNIPSELLSECVEFTFTDGSKGRMTREEIFAHLASHGDYHRGAVGRIMSQLSLSPPESFTGYLHKTEPQRRDQI